MVREEKHENPMGEISAETCRGEWEDTRSFPGGFNGREEIWEEFVQLCVFGRFNSIQVPFIESLIACCYKFIDRINYENLSLLVPRYLNSFSHAKHTYIGNLGWNILQSTSMNVIIFLLMLIHHWWIHIKHIHMALKFKFIILSLLTLIKIAVYKYSLAE